MDHTPTPWRLATLDESDGWQDAPLILQEDGCSIGEMSRGFPHVNATAGDRANAEFVVRAVNSHDALLAACKAAIANVPRVDLSDEIDAQLRAAIQKAEAP